MLALIFSILMEVLFFAAFKLFGTVQEFSGSGNFWVQSWHSFHRLSIIVAYHCALLVSGDIWQEVIGLVMFFFIALLEWWIVFSAGIWFIRHFTRKEV